MNSKEENSEDILSQLRPRIWPLSVLLDWEQGGRARHDLSLAWLEAEGNFSEVDWYDSLEAGKKVVYYCTTL